MIRTSKDPSRTRQSHSCASHQQSLQILLACLGMNHVEAADCYANLGDVCMKLVAEGPVAGRSAKLAEAKKYYTEANRIVATSLGPEHTKCQQYASLLFIIDNFTAFQ